MDCNIVIGIAFTYDALMEHNDDMNKVTGIWRAVQVRTPGDYVDRKISSHYVICRLSGCGMDCNIMTFFQELDRLQRGQYSARQSIVFSRSINKFRHNVCCFLWNSRFDAY